MIVKIIKKLYWDYKERQNWKHKMNAKIEIVKLTKEEAEEILSQRRRKENERADAEDKGNEAESK